MKKRDLFDQTFARNFFDYISNLFAGDKEEVLIEFKGARISNGEKQDICGKLTKNYGYQTRHFKYVNGISMSCPKKSTKKIVAALRNDSAISSSRHLRNCRYQARKANLYYIPELKEGFAKSNVSMLEHYIHVSAKKILKAVGLNHGYSWNLENIGIKQAHKMTKGQGIRIGVIDSGINYKHDELEDRFDKLKGYNFIDDSNDPMDDNGHGTHVAGIAAGKTLGVAPEADLYAIKVLSQNGTGSEGDIINGIEWCIDHNVDIINMSLGSSYPSYLQEEVCEAAIAKGIFIAAAAGNSGYGPDYPAVYDGVTAVAAVDSDNEHADFSNIWETNDISAPGMDIYSCYLGSYKYLSGTSMAAPHVAGVAALGKSVHNCQGSDLESAIKKTAEKIGDKDEPDYESTFGAGLVRADNTVKYLSRK